MSSFTKLLFCVAVGFALTAFSGVAKSQTFSAVWIVQPLKEVFPKEMEVADGEPILRQKLRPIGLASLSEDFSTSVLGTFFQSHKILVKSGSDLVAVGKYFCANEPFRVDRKGLLKNSNFDTVCFIDQDQDGYFEWAGVAASDSTGVIVTIANYPSSNNAKLAYDLKDPVNFKGDQSVSIRYEQFFNFHGNRMLITEFSGKGNRQDITSIDTFKSKGPFPRELSILGAKFTILSAKPKSVMVQIDAAMPIQPFSIATYTTYSFY